ncbi:MAG: hypothetical protein IT198_11255 [Acidimicrobiia bacterium]|nr:hypothetical protein [Acidimicrobiia bacterium]
MLRRLAVTTAAVTAVILAGLAGPLVQEPVPALGSTPNRVAVVVDSGSEVKTACVEFAESSITGLAALERAGFAPAAWGFGSLGVAVCGMCGKGCPADASCLTCDSPYYWAYHRAPAGQTRFAFSQLGPSGTRVTDGDVEGWRYGTGAAPAFRSFVSVCGQSGATPTTSPAPVTTAARSGGGSASQTGGGPPSVGAESPDPDPEAGQVPGQAAQAPAEGASGEPPGDPAQAATRPEGTTDESRDVASTDLGATSGSGEQSGSVAGAWGWAALVAVLAGIGAVLAVQRFRRHLSPAWDGREGSDDRQLRRSRRR